MSFTFRPMPVPLSRGARRDIPCVCTDVGVKRRTPESPLSPHAPHGAKRSTLDIPEVTRGAIFMLEDPIVHPARIGTSFRGYDDVTAIVNILANAVAMTARGDGHSVSGLREAFVYAVHVLGVTTECAEYQGFATLPVRVWAAAGAACVGAVHGIAPGDVTTFLRRAAGMPTGGALPMAEAWMARALAACPRGGWPVCQGLESASQHVSLGVGRRGRAEIDVLPVPLIYETCVSGLFLYDYDPRDTVIAICEGMGVGVEAGMECTGIAVPARAVH